MGELCHGGWGKLAAAWGGQLEWLSHTIQAPNYASPHEPFTNETEQTLAGKRHPCSRFRFRILQQVPFGSPLRPHAPTTRRQSCSLHTCDPLAQPLKSTQAGDAGGSLESRSCHRMKICLRRKSTRIPVSKHTSSSSLIGRYYERPGIVRWG